VKADGTVWGWGANTYGQLGDGTTTSKLTPVQAFGLTDVTDVAAGFQHSLALKQDGTVWAWGINGNGQIGNSEVSNLGNTANQTTPQKIEGLTGVKAIAAGINHSFALTQDGAIWAWGYNDGGQLGDNTKVSVWKPKKVSPEGVTFVAVSSGVNHSLALDDQKNVWAWGTNNHGQFGDGTYNSKGVPTKIADLTGVTAIEAGFGYSVVLKEDGTVWACGLNDGGQLGNWYREMVTKPYQVAGLTGITEISANKYRRPGHSLAVKNDGTVWLFGSNEFGQLGDGTTALRHEPVRVGSIVTNAVSVSAGGDFSLAVKDDGTVLSWGKNNVGQLGDGTTANHSNAISPQGFESGVTLSATANGLTEMQLSWDYTGTTAVDKYVLKRGNTIIYSASGQAALGNKTFTDTGKSTYTFGLTVGTSYTYTLEAYDSLGSLISTKSVTASTEEIALPVPGATNVKVSAGYQHSLVLRSDGTVWSWGANAYGQLGDGTLTTKNISNQVGGLTHITDVAAGHQHSLALKDDGTVWAWGLNTYGQLGDGTTVNKLLPIQE